MDGTSPLFDLTVWGGSLPERGQIKGTSDFFLRVLRDAESYVASCAVPAFIQETDVEAPKP